MIFYFLTVTTTEVNAAAVVDSAQQQQDITDENSGCDDPRVLTCRTFPLFNYTELAAPVTNRDDLMVDCP